MRQHDSSDGSDAADAAEAASALLSESAGHANAQHLRLDFFR